jgi:hypothetical protein
MSDIVKDIKPNAHQKQQKNPFRPLINFNIIATDYTVL